MEIWKPIKNYEGMYEVSNMGRVRSLNRLIPRNKNSKKSYYKIKGRPVAITDNGNGYKLVSLSKQGRKNHYLHRLVATHFIPNPCEKYFVNHKDGDKSNNHVSNLEWVTHSENIVHSVKMGIHPSGIRVKNAIQIKDVLTGRVFDTIKEAALHYNVKYSLLKEAIARKRIAGYVPKHPIYKRLIEIK